MALEFVKDQGTGATVEATARLYRTEDDQLVGEDYTGRRWLFCVPGQQIPRDEAGRYGLLTEPEPEPEPESAKVPDKPGYKAIRAWAEENELEVPKRGRIPDAVIELYNESLEG